jgi:hypothetical protein
MKLTLCSSRTRGFDGRIFVIRTDNNASHSRAFRALNLDTNLVMETCEVTFDETLRNMCGSRTGGWSLPCVMSD